MTIKRRITVVVTVLAALGAAMSLQVAESPSMAAGPGRAAGAEVKKLPRLLDLGAKKCIPCKLMAPILEQLAKEYAGRMNVEFIDVWLKANQPAAKKYGIRMIPTQIFFDAAGKELWRHEGFLSKQDILAKWKELKVDLGDPPAGAFERFTPAKADTRPKDTICYLCDGTIGARTLVTVKTDKGPVRLCGPHCYFIMYSCLTADKTGLEKKVSVADWSTRRPVGATAAVYLRGLDEKTGRPWIRAFADRRAATAERQRSGGSTVSFATLQRMELAHRCGFCDRAVYPADASRVKVAGVHTWGCCPHCALGVAARTGKDIEVRQPDSLTGEMIVIKTLGGRLASLEPATAVGWFGMRKKPDGSWGSAGCFHQGNFTSVANLKKWLAKHPHETGRMISISQALANKMKLTPRQIAKACKIGECTPK